MRITNKYIISIFFFYLLFLLISYPLTYLLSSGVSEFKSDLISRIIVLIPLLIGLIFLIKKNNLKRFNGLDKMENRKFLFFPLLFLIYILFSNFHNILMIESFDLLLIITSVLLVGLTEELFFRGILFPFFISKLKTKKYFLLSSIFMSSIIFGIVHYISLINNNSIALITYQVIFAFCIGCLFCSITLRTKNIIIPSLFHSIINFKAYVLSQAISMNKKSIEYTEEFLSAMPEIPETTIWNLLTDELPQLLLFLILAYFLLWKIDNKEILKKLNIKSTTGNNVYN